MPYTAEVVDELAIIKSVHTEAINHDPALTYIQTGSERPGRPSLGAWLSYGLGDINKNLPGFVVLTASWTGLKTAEALYERLWGPGFSAVTARRRHPPVAGRSCLVSDRSSRCRPPNATEDARHSGQDEPAAVRLDRRS